MSTTANARPKTEDSHSRVKDALDDVRSAAQELHGALSDAVAKRGGAIKGDLESVPLKAKAIADSIGSSLVAQDAATKRSLGEAVTYLEATAAHAADALKNSGHAAVTSVQQAIADARASAQKISEAVAAKRSSSRPLKK
jgi:hypothetical protein